MRKQLQLNFRSAFEEEVYCDILAKSDIGVIYEPLSIDYMKEHRYTPDFLLENGVILEVKGRFTASDRAKHLKIKKQYGDLHDIRFVFQRPNMKLSKSSNTTYEQWCEKHGFRYCVGQVPEGWLL